MQQFRNVRLWSKQKSKKVQNYLRRGLEKDYCKKGACRMTKERAREINRKKGNTFPIWFIRKFAEEWDATVEDMKAEGRDLSKIMIVGKEDTKMGNIK